MANTQPRKYGAGGILPSRRTPVAAVSSPTPTPNHSPGSVSPFRFLVPGRSSLLLVPIDVGQSFRESIEPFPRQLPTLAFDLLAIGGLE